MTRPRSDMDHIRERLLSGDPCPLQFAGDSPTTLSHRYLKLSTLGPKRAQAER